MGQAHILHFQGAPSGATVAGPEVEETSHVRGILGDVAELPGPLLPVPSDNSQCSTPSLEE